MVPYSRFLILDIYLVRFNDQSLSCSVVDLLIQTPLGLDNFVHHVVYTSRPIRIGLSAGPTAPDPCPLITIIFY